MKLGILCFHGFVLLKKQVRKPKELAECCVGAS